MRLFTILLLALVPLSAQAITGKVFLEQCDAAFAKPAKDDDPQRTATKLVEAGTCVGYIGGTISGIGLMSGLMKQQNVIKKNLICLPKTLTPRELYNQVAKVIREDKNKADKQVRVYVYEHFVRNYPCPDETAPSAPSAPSLK